MEIQLKKPEIRDWGRLYRLYLTAFPGDERKPFSIIVNMYRKGTSDVWCITRQGKTVGLAITVNAPERVLLDYLAVTKKCRGLGVGSAAMGHLAEMYRGRNLYVEIESTIPPGRDLEERRKRKRFYENCGMEDMHVEAEVFGVRMELLGYGEKLTFEGYRGFYAEYYSPWAAEHILPVKE